MQTEQVAAFHQQRPDLVIATHLKRDLIRHAFLSARRQFQQLLAFLLDFDSRRLLLEGLARQRVLDQHPGDRQLARVLDVDDDGDFVADFRDMTIAFASGLQTADPFASQIATDGQHAQQHVHRIHQQTELQRHAQQQHGRRSEKPVDPRLRNPQRRISVPVRRLGIERYRRFLGCDVAKDVRGFRVGLRRSLALCGFAFIR